MNLSDIIAIGIVAVAFAIAAWRILKIFLRRKRNKQKACSNCSKTCSGSCCC